MRYLACLVLVVVLAGCTIATPTPTSGSGAARTAVPAMLTVIYQVRTISPPPGGMKADITYENAQGGTEQANDVSLTWSKQFDMKPGTTTYLSAQNKEDSGTIACDIVVNGDVWRHSESQGEFAIASCSGVLGQP